MIKTKCGVRDNIKLWCNLVHSPNTQVSPKMNGISALNETRGNPIIIFILFYLLTNTGRFGADLVVCQGIDWLYFLKVKVKVLL